MEMDCCDLPHTVHFLSHEARYAFRMACVYWNEYLFQMKKYIIKCLIYASSDKAQPDPYISQ